MPNGRHALVLGGGFSGVLAAHVLTGHVDRVTVVERDSYDDQPVARKGIPQMRHTHLLLGVGARTLDSLLPGTLQALLDAGAQRVRVPQDIAIHSAHGWWPRVEHDEYLIGCSRELCDWVVRRRALAHERIEILEETDVVGLTGDRGRITGARVRRRGSAGVTTLAADIVVDATGRSTRILDWLVDVGMPPVAEEIVDVGTAYATRVYQPDPETARATPALTIFAEVTGNARGGVLIPIEQGRWMVTLIGSRGTEPPTTPEGFLDFAGKLPHPAIADFVRDVPALGPPRGFRGMINRRPLFDQLPEWPTGVLTVGDSSTTLNPAHGHGLSAAALGIAQLRRHLEEHGLAPEHQRDLQLSVQRASDTAWSLAVDDDKQHRHLKGVPPTAVERLGVDRCDVMTLTPENVFRITHEYRAADGQELPSSARAGSAHGP